MVGTFYIEHFARLSTLTGHALGATVTLLVSALSAAVVPCGAAPTSSSSQRGNGAVLTCDRRVSPPATSDRPNRLLRWNGWRRTDIVEKVRLTVKQASEVELYFLARLLLESGFAN